MKAIILLTTLLSILLICIFFKIASESKEKQYSEYVEQTIYIDKSFNDDEAVYILEAATEWGKATENRVNYKIVRIEWNTQIEIENSLLINKVNSNSATILTLDYIFNKDRNTDIVSRIKTLGYYDDTGMIPTILLVGERLDSETYKRVIMHELGHSLGLQHQSGKEGENTLMYPSDEWQSENITKKDVDQYCKIHKCQIK